MINSIDNFISITYRSLYGGDIKRLLVISL
nr:MAG TPA: hypothetical protein [Caudoviricetes sp.]